MASKWGIMNLSGLGTLVMEVVAARIRAIMEVRAAPHSDELASPENNIRTRENRS